MKNLRENVILEFSSLCPIMSIAAKMIFTRVFKTLQDWKGKKYQKSISPDGSYQFSSNQKGDSELAS